jgi:mevalonate pyrophosphate decarboxylase
LASQSSANSVFSPLPWWMMKPLGGRAVLSARTKAKPAAVWRRRKCFMCSVSPARSRVRSNTVAAMRLSSKRPPVGRLKRQFSMPSCQSDRVKVKSPPLCALMK